MVSSILKRASSDLSQLVAGDGVSWKNSTNSLAGGPSGGMGDNVWNRDAIVAERAGFDCAKGHPAMGNYHHHQNPSAFKLDLVVISNICNLYDADGLYVIDSAQHSPLIGFAYDGFPIYGAYAYKEVNGSGGIVRMKSGYQLRNISTRTTYANGSTVTPGPPVSSTYPLGYFREDYEFITHLSDPDYLDAHNGRICVTPEYPAGTYAYFCTVDENWNSSYPYAVGPTFYGNKVAASVSSITEPVTQYTPVTSSVPNTEFDNLKISVYPNPATDLIAVQVNGLLKQDISVYLYELSGKLVAESSINKGSTIAYFDTRKYYSGNYLLKVISGDNMLTQKVSISRN